MPVFHERGKLVQTKQNPTTPTKTQFKPCEKSSLISGMNKVIHHSFILTKGAIIINMVLENICVMNMAEILTLYLFIMYLVARKIWVFLVLF